ncbi:diacylglycerol/lipid kinase family protein [Acinetobacter rathckeae]|uniref:diacylglycerol/lipid kinase family protein n=1 Tax=Acinetobacter rathckeae TaxID=2605272 RepID=UPI0018A2A4A2|nr:diacylglycerol kinase family protein [Acinetobacter rathckeae]MBF7687034.1 diacylglycerol kinase [Acinetobacter rathckeae]MBF7694562.1 diacylglycerol kinase [Acinetobacter rathckeae]
MLNLKPLSLVYNHKSGFHASHNDEVYEQMMTLFSFYGFEIQVFELSERSPISLLMKKIIARHQKTKHKGVVIGAGGDGTLNSIASHLIGTDIPLGILPLGTFNYVARALDIPLDLIKAAEVIVKGAPRAVHVARLNEHVYLNNASLGLYPLFIEQRERYNKYLGRFPLHAYTSALDVLLRKYKALKLELTIDGVKHPVTTSLVFLGNNQLQLKELNLTIADAAKEGKVAGVVVSKSDRISLIKLLVKLFKGNVEHADGICLFTAEHIEIKSVQDQPLYLAIDGELIEECSPLHISVHKHALNIMVPYATSSI